MWRQLLRGVCVFLVIVAAVLISVWAVMSFLDKHFGITLSLPPMGYFDAGDADIRSCAENVCANPERSERVSETACGALEPAAQYMCSMSRRMARLETELRILRGSCDLSEELGVYIAYASSQ